MGKLYQKDHIIFCDLKKRVTVTVEHKEPSGNQLEKSLDVSLTDDTDLYFLFTAKIYAVDYQRIKDQQGLLVEYNSFGQMLIDLITKCSNEEERPSPRYILQFSESSNPHMLRIIETTDFRHLTHLAIELTAANDEALKAYLVSYIRRKQSEYETTIDRLRKSELVLNADLRHSEQVLNEVTQKLRNVTITNEAEFTALKRQHDQEIINLKEANEAFIASLRNKHYSECKVLEDARITSTADLQSKLNSQNSELQILRASQNDLSSKITALNSLITEKENCLAVFRKENDVIKTDLTSEKNRREHLETTCSQLTNKMHTIEGDLSTKLNNIHVLELELNSQKDRTQECEEEFQKKCKGFEKLEKTLRQQTTELVKANSIIKQLQKDLKNTQTKAKLRGQVATEQEKVLATKEIEVEEANQSLEKLRLELNAEKDLRNSAEEKLLAIENSLAEAQKTIKSNENIINWLNRQISESYSSNMQQRLKLSGVPVAEAGVFDLESVNSPYGFDSYGAFAKDAPFLSNPSFVPYSSSLKSNLSRIPQPALAETTNLAPSCMNAVSSGSNENHVSTGSGHLVVLANGESVLSRPPVRLSSSRKSSISTARRDGLSCIPSTATVSEAIPGFSRISTNLPKADQPYSFLPLSTKSTPSKENQETPFHLPDSSDSCLEDKNQQSLQSAYFPRASTAR